MTALIPSIPSTTATTATTAATTSTATTTRRFHRYTHCIAHPTRRGQRRTIDQLLDGALLLLVPRTLTRFHLFNLQRLCQQVIQISLLLFVRAFHPLFATRYPLVQLSLKGHNRLRWYALTHVDLHQEHLAVDRQVAEHGHPLLDSRGHLDRLHFDDGGGEGGWECGELVVDGHEEALVANGVEVHEFPAGSLVQVDGG